MAALSPMHDVRIFQFAAAVGQLRIEGEREEALLTLEAIVDSLIEDAEADFDGTNPPPLAHVLEQAIRTLLRLAWTGPDAEMRTRCNQLVDTIAQKLTEWNTPVHVPELPAISSFLSLEELKPIDTDDEEVLSELRLAFESDGRVSNMTRVMATHPKFLLCFREFHNHILLGEGPIALDVRHFIAIMAASRHCCQYLIDIHLHHFRELGGDEEWLTNREAIPGKLRRLSIINSVLAYQPWRLQQSHLALLLNSPEDDNWSLPELMQAVLLLSHFHALAGFCLATGLLPEVDLKPLDGADDNVDEPPPEPGVARVNSHEPSALFASVVAKLKAAANADPNDDLAAPTTPVANTHDATPSSVLMSPPNESEDAAEVSFVAPVEDHWRTYFSASNLPEWDSAIEEHHVNVNTGKFGRYLIKTMAFSWVDHGFELVQRFGREYAQLLDTEFQVITQLTYDFIGVIKDVKTKPVRSAIWHYSSFTRGIINDEFWYKDINDVLSKECKAFCKLLACEPERITIDDFSWSDFLPDEKIHVALLAMDSSKQASLLYFLRALQDFLKQQRASPSLG